MLGASANQVGKDLARVRPVDRWILGGVSASGCPQGRREGSDRV